MLDLENKAFVIFGLKGSGKTELAKYLASKFKNQAFIYDTLSEYPDEPFDSYRPKSRNSVKELEAVTRLIMRSREYRLYVIDEANKHCPSKPHPLPQAIADLNDWHRHYDLAIGYIARRPVQLNQDLTELASYIFIFTLPGKNDIAYLNDIKAGLGDAARELPEYHFIVVGPNRDFKVHSPIPLL